MFVVSTVDLWWCWRSFGMTMRWHCVTMTVVMLQVMLLSLQSPTTSLRRCSDHRHLGCRCYSWWWWWWWRRRMRWIIIIVQQLLFIYSKFFHECLEFRRCHLLCRSCQCCKFRNRLYFSFDRIIFLLFFFLYNNSRWQEVCCHFFNLVAYDYRALTKGRKKLLCLDRLTVNVITTAATTTIRIAAANWQCPIEFRTEGTNVRRLIDKCRHFFVVGGDGYDEIGWRQKLWWVDSISPHQRQDLPSFPPDTRWTFFLAGCVCCCLLVRTSFFNRELFSCFLLAVMIPVCWLWPPWISPLPFSFYLRKGVCVVIVLLVDGKDRSNDNAVWMGKMRASSSRLAALLERHRTVFPVDTVAETNLKFWWVLSETEICRNAKALTGEPVFQLLCQERTVIAGWQGMEKNKDIEIKFSC